ncbi:MAG: glycosyltransferase [Planctomycetes bacterium]|nr:glycosyltransferase [Planctomycetota bacterium]
MEDTPREAKASHVPRAQEARTETRGAPAVRDVDVSVIVPITMGAGRVREVVEALSRELDRLGKSWECILVFDGVRGKAWIEANELAERFEGRVRSIGFQQTFGESVCLSAGFEQARGRVLVTSPQYVQVDPFELGKMLAALDAGADFVTPWRHPRIDPYLNRVQSALFNWVMRRIIHGKFHDLNCYFRAFKREVLEELTIYGDMYRFLPVIVYRQGFQVVEVQVRHLQEWGGAGFFGVGVYLRRLLDILGMVFLAKFTLKPLRFFGTLGGALAIVGGVLLSICIWDRVFHDEGLYQRPLFLLSLIQVVLGVQIVGFGLVGEIIIYTQAKNLREYRIERIWESRTPRDDDPRKDDEPRSRGA